MHLRKKYGSRASVMRWNRKMPEAILEDKTSVTRRRGFGTFGMSVTSEELDKKQNVAAMLKRKYL